MAVTARKPHSRDLVSAVLLMKLSASEKLVLQALCWHYPNAYPSVARIATMASQSERWVRQCLRSLQKKGLIEVHYRRDDNAQGTNFYTINPDRILMQAGKRAKTTLKSGGTHFRGVGNSVPGEGEELTSPKQSALDKEQEQNNKQQKTTETEATKSTYQEEEIPSRDDDGIELEENLNLGRDEDYEPSYQQSDEESSTELSWEVLGEIENWHIEETGTNNNPYLQSSPKEPKQSTSNREVIGPTPSPHSAAPPSPPRGTYAWACHLTQSYRTQPEEFTQEEWDELCYRYGITEIADALELFLKYDSSAKGRPLSSFSFLADGYVEQVIELQDAGNDGL